ncbi:MAG: choice-of-anchor Q domain-containing protein [Crocinitomicaceae bacterium]
MKKSILLVTLISLAYYSVATTFTVNSAANNGSGTFRQAIIDANNNPGIDTIVFDTSINGIPITINSWVGVTDDINVMGNGISNTIIDGTGTSGMIQILGPGASFASFSNIQFRNADGAIIVNFASTYFDNCYFLNNFVFGALQSGGAIYYVPSIGTSDTLHISETTFDGNDAWVDGGAIYFADGRLILESSTIMNGEAFNGDGGGIYIGGGILEMSNSTLHNNWSTNGGGGGIYDNLMGAGSFISNSTIVNNQASNGGGIYSGASSVPSQFSIYNSIIANNLVGNLGPDIYINDTLLGAHQNNIVRNCYNPNTSCPTWHSQSNPNIDPSGPQLNGGPTPTVALLVGSPAIDNANLTFSSQLDQRGELRCPIPDIGAYESNPGAHSTFSFSTTACSQYTVPSGDETYTMNGTYMDTIPNSLGCDSILTINLIIPPLVNGIDTQIACDSLLWIDGNTYYSNNNTATFNIIASAANGCDSIVTLDLTMNFSNTATDLQTACNTFTWIDGNTYTSSNSTATHTLTNVAGCDSVVTLNLTINTVNSSVTQLGALLTADETGATYQWLDCPAMTSISGAINQSYSATANGDYAVIVTNNGCTDTSVCYTVFGVGIVENDFGNKLLLYPNPTDGNFSIDLGNNYQTTIITITDLNGRTIHVKRYNDSQLLNLKLEEPAGAYLLIVETGDKKAVIRLIKE